MRKRILFVDDEVNILNGLRRMLRPLQHEWEMTFAESAAAALALMADHPFDVLVSDMRMPGMDGAQLLNEVRLHYPQTVRFVLSGYSDQEAVVCTVGLAHQFLAKPCSVDALKAAIARTDTLRHFIGNSTLQQIISSIDTLPTTRLELLRLLAGSTITPTQIGAVVAQDQGLTTTVLQVINSDCFSLPKRISDPQEAVTILGVDTVRALVNTVAVFSVLENSTPKEFIDNLYAHAVRVGRWANQIAHALDGNNSVPKNAMLAGMLHDVGKLVLYSHVREAFNEALRLADQQNLFLYQAEREIIGVSHADVGAYLLALWGFEDDLVRTIAYHHEPSQAEACDDCLAAVHIANGFDHIGLLNNAAIVAHLDAAYLQKAGIAREQIEAWYVVGIAK